MTPIAVMAVELRFESPLAPHAENRVSRTNKTGGHTLAAPKQVSPLT